MLWYSNIFFSVYKNHKVMRNVSNFCIYSKIKEEYNKLINENYYQ